MKQRLKIGMAGLMIGSSLAFAACSGHASKAHDVSDTTQSESGHQHTYACPMHSEVTGKEGDTCPKCGMKLEHNEDAGATNSSNYFMQFSANPSIVNPSQEVTLSLTPKIKGNEKQQVPLGIEHEKKIHLILVNDDLSWFDHIHPEYAADGSYQVTTKFPAGGKYTLFADYKPTGGSHALDKLTVSVTGTVPAAKIYNAERLTGDAGDGFTVTLTPEGSKFITEVPMRISGAVKLNGKDVNASTLENYLGAKAHMVVVSRDEKVYLHVHPAVKHGKFDLRTTFDKPGIYRGWIQFRSKGKIYTADFVIDVKKGTDEDKRKASAGMMKMPMHTNDINYTSGTSRAIISSDAGGPPTAESK